MRKITETGDFIDDDRVQMYVSSGQGNTHLPEVHIRLVDPTTGVELQAWFYRDEAIAALLDPNPEIKPSPTLGAVDAEVEL